MNGTINGGLLIAIEGIDGAGKTTLARRIADDWRSRGVRVHASKEPTAGQWGLKLRSSAAAGRLTPEQEVDYLLRDRREHVETLIRPALERGEVIILDRYYPSMIAYQGAAGVRIDDLLEANSFAPRPDVLLVLDLEPATGLDRIRARGDTPNAFETVETLNACRSIFLALEARKHIIDASRSADEVHAEAMMHILRTVARKAEQAGDSVAACRKVAEFMPAL